MTMPTYAEARAAFLVAARSVGAIWHEYAHPLRGPDNTPLAIYVAVLGNPNTAKKLVLISGVHGVEAYAGSMIQTDLTGRLSPS